MIQDSSVKQTLIRDSISKTGLDVAVFLLLELPNLFSSVGWREKMCQFYEFCNLFIDCFPAVKKT